MKNVIQNLNTTTYVLRTLLFIYIVLASLFLCYIYDINNANNSVYTSSIISKHFIKISAVLIFFSFFINLPFLFFRKMSKKIYFGLLVILFYLPSFIDFLHVLLYKARANVSSYFSIFSTNSQETLEFFHDYSTIGIFFGVLIFGTLPLIAFLIYKRIAYPVFKKVIAISFGLLFFASSFITFSRSEISYWKEFPSHQLISAYNEYQVEIQLLNTAFEKTSPLQVEKNEISGKETYIIVIGESTSKFHMGLYGYHRNTNPKLSKLKNELTIFNNVKSSQVHTIESMKDIMILTDKKGEFTSNTIIDCFNQAGFQTYWLSNQPYLGKNETIVSTISKRANQQIFISSSGEQKFDEELLPQLDKVLSQNVQKKVVFIHLMGTHLSYQNRYPNSFNQFNDKNISVFGKKADSFINHYDNAILYNDFIIAEIIKKTKIQKGINTVVYFSDHGDEVYDFRDFHGHSSSLLSKYMNSIPFIIWSNKPSKEQMKSNIDIELSLKDFSHTVQDLLGVRTSYFDTNKSFLNPLATFIRNTNNEELHRSPPDTITFPTKIWVHRVNSIQRLKEIQNQFKGMEIDLVFENGKFDVGHPPVESIDLTLDDFFSKVEKIKGHYFWLDIKNLNENNAGAIVNRLNYLTNKYINKKNIIVEVYDPKQIKKVKSQGYYTSYYLSDLATMNEAEQKKSVKSIGENIDTTDPSFISQSINNYFLMKQHFGSSNKITWALDLDWNDPANHQRINTLLNSDHSIKVCLVNFTSKGWR